jgi:hypothetical protein
MKLPPTEIYRFTLKINAYVIKNIIECAVTCVSLLKFKLSCLEINQREQTHQKSYSMHVFQNLFDSLYAAEEYRLQQNLFFEQCYLFLHTLILHPSCRKIFNKLNFSLVCLSIAFRAWGNSKGHSALFFYAL